MKHAHEGKDEDEDRERVHFATSKYFRMIVNVLNLKIMFSSRPDF